jgi:hypothetical protein
MRTAILICVLVACAALAQDIADTSAPKGTALSKQNLTASAIIDRSLRKYRENLDIQHNYIFRQREVNQELDGKGQVKKTEIHTYEVFMPCPGDWYEKLVEKNDKPLNEGDQKKESDKLDKYCADEKKHEETHQRDLEKWKEERQERDIADGIKKVYNFTLDGEEQRDGRQVYVVSAEPNPAYKPDKRWEHLLAKMRGKLWIDAADYQVVKVEADLFDDFHVGLFLFKLNKGAHFEFEQARINGETWLPSREYLRGSGRVTFVTGRFQQNTTYSDYRKFRTDTKITGVIGEGDPSAQPPTSADPR